MAAIALSPVAEAVMAALIPDATLQALTTGGWHDDLPAAPVYPCGYLELQEREGRGFGTGGMPELELRAHVLSQYHGKREAQAIASRVVTLLKDAAIDVSVLSDAGYQQCGLVFYDETVPLSDVEILGEKVIEIVSFFRVIVEQTS